MTINTLLGVLAFLPLAVVGYLMLKSKPPIFRMFLAMLGIALGYLAVTDALEDIGGRVASTLGMNAPAPAVVEKAVEPAPAAEKAAEPAPAPEKEAAPAPAPAPEKAAETPPPAPAPETAADTPAPAEPEAAPGDAEGEPPPAPEAPADAPADAPPAEGQPAPAD